MGRWTVRRASEVPPSTGASNRFVIALEEARRGLEYQRADLESVRNRSVALLGVGTVTTTLVAGVRGSEPPAIWTLLATASVVVLVVVALLIGWPRKFHLTQDVEIIIRWMQQHEPTEDEARKQLATRMNQQYEKNAKTLKRMFWALQVSIVVLAAEIVFLALDYWGIG